MQNKTLKGNRIIYNFISGILEVSVCSQQGSDPTTTGQNAIEIQNDARCDVQLITQKISIMNWNLLKPWNL